MAFCLISFFFSFVFYFISFCCALYDFTLMFINLMRFQAIFQSNNYVFLFTALWGLFDCYFDTLEFRLRSQLTNQNSNQSNGTKSWIENKWMNRLKMLLPNAFALIQHMKYVIFANKNIQSKKFRKVFLFDSNIHEFRSESFVFASRAWNLAYKKWFSPK